MKYTVHIEIPEIDSLRKEVEALKLRLAGILGDVTDKEWYTLMDLSLMLDIPYSTFRQSPNRWPDNPQCPYGKRTLYHKEDVATWLLKKQKNLRSV